MEDPGTGETIVRKRQVSLRLFIAADTLSSNRAIANLHRLMEAMMESPSSVEIVDVIANPAIAEDAGITRAPTLVLNGARPRRQIEGELSDLAAVAARLGLPIRQNRALA